MIQKLRTRLKNSSGFSLSELLITLLILLMVTVVMAAGIPSALRALYKVEDSANAQVLLSTAVTCLRDELSTASDVKVDGTTITYTTESGSESRLTVVVPGPTEKKDFGINLQEYVDVLPDSDQYKHLLVSNSAANKNLYVTYVKATYDYENGLVTISGLKAVKYKTESVGAAKDAEFPLDSNVVIRVLPASGHA